jgi:DNA polymerase-3 subunit epsilon
MIKKYSLIDIETTGGHRRGNKIIEVAILNFSIDSEDEFRIQIDGEYSSLIDPEIVIPSTITYLTGIDQSMVQHAPKFYQIAKDIVEMTEDRIFVAHNVFFDYNFIKHEFSELGYSYSREKACTVRLARQKLPGHKSYSLGKICEDLGIEVKSRHRAMGDVKATFELIKKIEASSQGSLFHFKGVSSKKLVLPPHLVASEIEKLPHRPGVYYFYDQEGKLLYIGKSKDIKTRVQSHFRVDMKRKKDIQLKNLVAQIDYQLAGHEILAMLIECQEIKTHRPPFNHQYNRVRFPYGLKLKYDENGVLDLQVEGRKADSEYLYHFASKSVAKKRLSKIYRTVFGVERDSIHFREKYSLLLSTLGASQINSMLEKIYRYSSLKNDEGRIPLPGRSRQEKAILSFKDHSPTQIEYIKSGETVDVFSLNSDQDLKDIFTKWAIESL